MRIGLLRFVRGLSSDRSERRRLGAAVVTLLRQRRRSLIALGPFLRVVPTAGMVKLQLWQAMARSCIENYVSPTLEEKQVVLAEAIRSTQAYLDSKAALSRDRNGFVQRGAEYPQLRRSWEEQPPKQVVVFHHFDRRGLLPDSWQEALLQLRTAGWQVIFSSSYVDPSISTVLKSADVQIVCRANIGRCLGAYRDLALLLRFTPSACQHLRSLVLCNDSNLLVQSPEVLVAQLEKWTFEAEADSRPVLAGLTDSCEHNSYHLQSFLLYANQALLQHPVWLHFWLQFAIDCPKDDLINHGEIGLSQALLSAGVELRPSYSLVQGLLTNPAMAAELKSYGIAQPIHVNQSLFAWRSLLASGFPLVKKHVLFQLAEHRGKLMAIAELAEWIPPERRNLLAHDIEQLLISRYSSRSTRMG